MFCSSHHKIAIFTGGQTGVTVVTVESWAELARYGLSRCCPPEIDKIVQDFAKEEEEKQK